MRIFNTFQYLTYSTPSKCVKIKAKARKCTMKVVGMFWPFKVDSFKFQSSPFLSPPIPLIPKKTSDVKTLLHDSIVWCETSGKELSCGTYLDTPWIGVPKCIFMGKTNTCSLSLSLSLSLSQLSRVDRGQNEYLHDGSTIGELLW